MLVLDNLNLNRIQGSRIRHRIPGTRTCLDWIENTLLGPEKRQPFSDLTGLWEANGPIHGLVRKIYHHRQCIFDPAFDNHAGGSAPVCASSNAALTSLARSYLQVQTQETGARGSESFPDSNAEPRTRLIGVNRGSL